MSPSLELVAYPELVFGIAGPIGVDMDEITDSLTNALKSVRYDTTLVKLTTLMRAYRADVPPPSEKDFYSDIQYKMDHANALCSTYGNSDTLARIAIRDIKRLRKDATGNQDKPQERMAYIIRQIKRPDEVNLFRKVYGRQFILISAYGSSDERSKRIESKLRRSLVDPNKIREKVEHLISRDADENTAFGQQLRDSFPLGRCVY